MDMRTRHLLSSKKIFEAATLALLQPSVKAALAREGRAATLLPSPEKFAAF